MNWTETTVLEVLASAGTLLGGIGGTVLLFAPGYVLSRVFSRGVRGPELGDQAFLAATAVGGVLTHAMLLWWTMPLWVSVAQTIRAGSLPAWNTYLEIALWAFAVLLAVPATLGAVWAHVMDVEPKTPVYRALDLYHLTTARRVAEAWIWIFSRMHRRGARQWLKIRLRDGRTYMGFFAGDSFASSDARVRDLYLQETWDLNADGQPAAERTPNAGVWIHGADIAAVEFYEERRSTKEERDA